MSDYDRKIERLQREVEALRSEYERAKDMTAKVLAAAEANGVDRIGINRVDATVHEGGSWPFSEFGNLFAKGRRDDDGTGVKWPVVWKVAEDAGISGGCGNPDQHQISNVPLVDGIYEQVDGVWRMVDRKEVPA